MLIRCRKLSFGSESQIHRSQLNFYSDSRIRCQTHISAAKRKFAAANSSSTATPKFTAKHIFQQRLLIRSRQLSFDSESQFRCRQLSFGSESQFRCRQLNFGSESKIRCRTHISAANANSLQTSQFRQRITISLEDT